MDRSKAHDTRLGRRVNFRALEMGRAEHLACSDDGTNFGVARGIVRLEDFVVPLGNDHSLANDAGAERAAVPSLDSSIGLFESDFHEVSISIRHSA